MAGTDGVNAGWFPTNSATIGLATSTYGNGGTNNGAKAAGNGAIVYIP